MKKAIEEIKKTLGSKLYGLVIDLRNNPGGLLDQATSIVNLFCDKGVIVSVKGRNPDQSTTMSAIKGRAVIKDVPIVILINEGSASASEIMAGALQDHRIAVIMGEASFGKGSVQTMYPLAHGKKGGVKLTTARFYTPLGKPIQGHGIKPDVSVEQLKGAVIDKPKINIKEKDLAHSLSAEHIAGAQEGSEKNHTPPVQPAPSVPGGKPVEGALPDGATQKPEAITDYQLVRALETVKALYIFQQSQKDRAVSGS
jgi:carboxyl-terminal processing protease